MKTLLFLLFFPLFTYSQKDTIFKKEGKPIPCTITLITENAIFFKDKKDFGDELLLSKIVFFSQSGIRKKLYDPSIIDYKYYKIDTAYNEVGKIKLSKVFEFNDTTLSKDRLYQNPKFLCHV